MCSYCLSNFSLFNKLFYLLPSSHNNSLLSDCIPFCPSPFSVHFCSHSILVMLHYSTFMRSGFWVSSDANAFSCAMGQRLSFGFTQRGQWYIKVSEPLLQVFFKELTFTWGINEAVPATKMRKNKERQEYQEVTNDIYKDSGNSVQFSHSVVSNSLRSHGLQHARPPCPSPTPRIYSNSCTLSRWCHSTISSSVVPFSCLQSFPASGSFQKSQFFASGGQSIGVSASTSDLPVNIQDWFPLEWTSWISLQYKGLTGVFSNTTVQKHQSSVLSFL